jgi:hypothetical protein
VNFFYKRRKLGKSRKVFGFKCKFNKISYILDKFHKNMIPKKEKKDCGRLPVALKIFLQISIH